MHGREHRHGQRRRTRAADGNSHRKPLPYLGDSTFIHSGITGLIDAVYGQEAITVLILDNRITGMTGHQHNPATGFDIHGNPAPMLDLEALCRACGVEHIVVVDPLDLAEVKARIAGRNSARRRKRCNSAQALRIDR